MTVTHTAPRTDRTAPAPPRWALVAAHVATLTPLPSGIWRVCLALGWSAGYTEQGYTDLDLAGWGTAYVLGLTLLTEGAALLTLGLVQPWGERLPAHVPVIGGRRVRPRAAVAAAVAGSLALIALWTPLLWWWALPHPDMTTTGSAVVGLLYLPLVAWGPLLLAVTWSYRRRHVSRGDAR